MKIFNSIKRKKNKFHSLKPGHLTMYVCGMTVYDQCHIGHARVMVFFDLVKRWFEAKGFTVTYVRNITDIDDKIIKRAVDEKVSVNEYTKKYIKELHNDEKSLFIQKPSFEPQATRYVSEMIELIEKLVKKDYAYISETGDVNFAVRSFPDYGKLSGKSIEQLRVGHRISIDEKKRDPLDFVLWKGAKQGEPDDVIWNSPFGAGRPGWHIECSAMSNALLGKKFDIHGGGADLQFPHHENEIAQSECGYGVEGESHVNTWMHVGFVTMKEEKMSKSLNNFLTIKSVIGEHDPESLRYFLLKTHYRKPLSYSDEQMRTAQSSLQSLQEALLRKNVEGKFDIVSRQNFVAQLMNSKHESAVAFKNALDDDFNTPLAFAEMFKYANLLKKEKSRLCSEDMQEDILRGMGEVLGLLNNYSEKDDLQREIKIEKLSTEKIEQIISLRQSAKEQKNFELADKLREELEQHGVGLEDGPDGTTWKFQRIKTNK